MRKSIIAFIFALICISLNVNAKYYAGRIVDIQNVPISYASIYMQKSPMRGTVSGNNGEFKMNITDSVGGNLIVSCVGYKTKILQNSLFKDSIQVNIVLEEDAIELEGTVVEHKVKRRSRKKTMEELLKNIINRMDIDYTDKNVKYKVKSDVLLASEGTVITFEELLGDIVQIPKDKTDKYSHDSLQFKGLYSKRYIEEDTEMRARSALDRSENVRTVNFAGEMDSGTVTHRLLWGGNLKHIILELAQKPGKWTLGRENDSLAVMTYTDTYNLLGIVKAEVKYHIIIDNYTYRIYRVSEDMNVKFNIPFGYKLKKNELKWLNAISMGRQFDRFRLRKANINVRRNVYYNTLREFNHPDKKIMVVDMEVSNNKGLTLKYNTKANAEVLEIQETDVKPYTSRQLRERVIRKNIPLQSIK